MFRHARESNNNSEAVALQKLGEALLGKQVMTPYEMAKMVHRELSPVAPKLSAALNRALIDIGEGSFLVGLGPGMHEDDHVSFQEVEHINLQGNDPASILAKIAGVIWKLEEHSSWKVLVDKKAGSGPHTLELLYTIFRSKTRS